MEETKEETGYTVARIEEAQNYRVTIKSFDEPMHVGDWPHTTTLGQIIGVEDNREALEHEADVRARVQRVRETVLSPREREVIERYFGFGGRTSMSLREIGATWKISRERARQLKDRALRKLRAATEHHSALLEVFATSLSIEPHPQLTVDDAAESREGVASDPSMDATQSSSHTPVALYQVAASPKLQHVHRNARGRFVKTEPATAVAASTVSTSIASVEAAPLTSPEIPGWDQQPLPRRGEGSHPADPSMILVPMHAELSSHTFHTATRPRGQAVQAQRVRGVHKIQCPI